MDMNIGVIKGDGIGPEIVDEAMKVLDKTAEVYGHQIEYTQLLMGGASIDVNGVPLTEETLEQAKKSDAVLMGSIGGDAKTSPWYRLEPSKRPEAGLLQLRKGLSGPSLKRYQFQERHSRENMISRRFAGGSFRIRTFRLLQGRDAPVRRVLSLSL